MRTNLLDQAEWVNFPKNQFLSIDLVANVVLQLVDGGQPAGQGLTDSRGGPPTRFGALWVRRRDLNQWDLLPGSTRIL